MNRTLEIFLENTGESRIVSHSELYVNGLLSPSANHPDVGACVSVEKLRRYLYKKIKEASKALEGQRSVERRKSNALEGQRRSKASSETNVSESEENNDEENTFKRKQTFRKLENDGLYDIRFTSDSPSRVKRKNVKEEEEFLDCGQKYLPSHRFLELEYHSIAGIGIENVVWNGNISNGARNILEPVTNSRLGSRRTSFESPLQPAEVSGAKKVVLRNGDFIRLQEPKARQPTKSELFRQSSKKINQDGLPILDRSISKNIRDDDGFLNNNENCESDEALEPLLSTITIHVWRRRVSAALFYDSIEEKTDKIVYLKSVQLPDMTEINSDSDDSPEREKKRDALLDSEHFSSVFPPTLKQNRLTQKAKLLKEREKRRKDRRENIIIKKLRCKRRIVTFSKPWHILLQDVMFQLLWRSSREREFVTGIERNCSSGITCSSYHGLGLTGTTTPAEVEFVLKEIIHVLLGEMDEQVPDDGGMFDQIVTNNENNIVTNENNANYDTSLVCNIHHTYKFRRHLVLRAPTTSKVSIIKPDSRFKPDSKDSVSTIIAIDPSLLAQESDQQTVPSFVPLFHCVCVSENTNEKPLGSVLLEMLLGGCYDSPVANCRLGIEKFDIAKHPISVLHLVGGLRLPGLRFTESDIGRILLNHAHFSSLINTRDPSFGWTPLLSAAASGNLSFLKQILHGKHDYLSLQPPFPILEEKIQVLNVCSISNETALYLACKNKHYEVSRILLDYIRDFLNVSMLDIEGRNMETTRIEMHGSIEQSHEMDFPLILFNYVNQKEFTSLNTALSIACYNGCPRISKLLLDHKALVGVRNKEGKTPLMMCVCGVLLSVNEKDSSMPDAVMCKWTQSPGRAKESREDYIQSVKDRALGRVGKHSSQKTTLAALTTKLQVGDIHHLQNAEEHSDRNLHPSLKTFETLLDTRYENSNVAAMVRMAAPLKCPNKVGVQTMMTMNLDSILDINIQDNQGKTILNTIAGLPLFLDHTEGVANHDCHSGKDVDYGNDDLLHYNLVLSADGSIRDDEGGHYSGVGRLSKSQKLRDLLHDMLKVLITNDMAIMSILAENHASSVGEDIVLKEAIDVNLAASSSTGNSPLYNAILSNQPQVVELLLYSFEKTIDANGLQGCQANENIVLQNSKRTCLTLASDLNRIEIARLLVKWDRDRRVKELTSVNTFMHQVQNVFSQAADKWSPIIVKPMEDLLLPSRRTKGKDAGGSPNSMRKLARKPATEKRTRNNNPATEKQQLVEYLPKNHWKEELQITSLSPDKPKKKPSKRKSKETSTPIIKDHQSSKIEQNHDPTPCGFQFTPSDRSEEENDWVDDPIVLQPEDVYDDRIDAEMSILKAIRPNHARISMKDKEIGLQNESRNTSAVQKECLSPYSPLIGIHQLTNMKMRVVAKESRIKHLPEIGKNAGFDIAMESMGGVGGSPSRNPGREMNNDPSNNKYLDDESLKGEKFFNMQSRWQKEIDELSLNLLKPGQEVYVCSKKDAVEKMTVTILSSDEDRKPKKVIKKRRTMNVKKILKNPLLALDQKTKEEMGLVKKEETGEEKAENQDIKWKKAWVSKSYLKANNTVQIAFAGATGKRVDVLRDQIKPIKLLLDKKKLREAKFLGLKRAAKEKSENILMGLFYSDRERNDQENNTKNEPEKTKNVKLSEKEDVKLSENRYGKNHYPIGLSPDPSSVVNNGYAIPNAIVPNSTHLLLPRMIQSHIENEKTPTTRDEHFRAFFCSSSDASSRDQSPEILQGRLFSDNNPTLQTSRAITELSVSDSKRVIMEKNRLDRKKAKKESWDGFLNKVNQEERKSLKEFAEDFKGLEGESFFSHKNSTRGNSCEGTCERPFGKEELLKSPLPKKKGLHFIEKYVKDENGMRIRRLELVEENIEQVTEGMQYVEKYVKDENGRYVKRVSLVEKPERRPERRRRRSLEELGRIEDKIEHRENRRLGSSYKLFSDHEQDILNENASLLQGKVNWKRWERSGSRGTLPGMSRNVTPFTSASPSPSHRNANTLSNRNDSPLRKLDSPTKQIRPADLQIESTNDTKATVVNSKSSTTVENTVVNSKSSTTVENTVENIHNFLNVNEPEYSTYKTALMIAAEKGYDMLLEILLQHPEIDLRLRDREGKTALDWAIAKRQKSCIKLLKEAG